MFVRWKKRKGKRTFGRWDGIRGHSSHATPDPTHAAFLVESKRVDGKPRQKVIAFLGSIRQAYIERPDFYAYRALFLDRIDERLSRIDLTDAQKRDIRAKVYKVVPSITAEERAAMEGDRSDALSFIKNL